MLIHNYGLFWRRDHVHWGVPGQSGHLKGVPAQAKTYGDVDFRLQQGIYCLYDETFKLVYVGQAGSGEDQRLLRRLRNHRTDALSQRWTRFSWFGINKVNSTSGELKAERMKANSKIEDVLNHIEAILISAAEPPLNRQGGKFGPIAEQYLQWRDPDRVPPDTEVLIRQIWERMAEQ